MSFDERWLFGLEDADDDGPDISVFRSPSDLRSGLAGSPGSCPEKDTFRGIWRICGGVGEVVEPSSRINGWV